jgi:hypothetical protein
MNFRQKSLTKEQFPLCWKFEKFSLQYEGRGVAGTRSKLEILIIFHLLFFEYTLNAGESMERCGY